MLTLQNPNNEDSLLLQESLLEAASTSSSGGGAFAWATAGGLDLLFTDVFLEFARRSDFLLAVGIHSVTTPTALKKMSQINEATGRPVLNVFMPNNESNLFHPKYTWFKQPHGGVLIIGSGNLTLGGLRDNWEAYATVPLNRDGIMRVRSTFNNWISDNATNLVRPDNQKAIQRAKQNTAWTKNNRPRHPDEVGTGNRVFEPTKINKVLVAEIPKASTRWKQANFDIHTYENFFGAEIGTKKYIMLQSIDSDGNLGKIEKRPSVEVKSRNYRFELDSASGLDYPEDGRPIAVFLRLRTRTFLYRLSLPYRDENHDQLAEFVEDNADESPTTRIRRIEADLSDAIHLSDVKLITEKVADSFADE
jgi:HKD family nuclease